MFGSALTKLNLRGIQVVCTAIICIAEELTKGIEVTVLPALGALEATESLLLVLIVSLSRSLVALLLLIHAVQHAVLALGDPTAKLDIIVGSKKHMSFYWVGTLHWLLLEYHTNWIPKSVDGLKVPVLCTLEPLFRRFLAFQMHGCGLLCLKGPAYLVLHYVVHPICLSLCRQFFQIVYYLDFALVLISQGAVKRHVSLAASGTASMKDLIQVHI